MEPAKVFRSIASIEPTELKEGSVRVKARVFCEAFPCKDVDHAGYAVPALDIKPSSVSIVMISEACPPDPRNYYYARGSPLFEQTTVQAFQDAGAEVASMRDILDLGVYVTTAVKCSKRAYSIDVSTIDECSRLLEKEVALFPDIKAFLLMGDVAIRAINTIAKRNGEGRVIPAGSTYRIRGGQFRFRGVRALPSYLQAGPSSFIEKSKRKMIAEDIAAALSLV
jgi:uracil-DNA glycosylase